MSGCLKAKGNQERNEDYADHEGGRAGLGSPYFCRLHLRGRSHAQAGVSYMVGRESRVIFGESLAGVHHTTPYHQFLWPTSAYEQAGRLWPNVDPGPLAPEREGDKKVQSYNFRLILTTDPENRLPWTKPVGYNPRDFALLRYYLSHFQANSGHAPNLHDVHAYCANSQSQGG